MSEHSHLARFFFGRIFPIPFILAGAAVMAFGIRDFVRAKSSPDWPTAPGIVVESRVESSSSDGSTTYGARIRYEYTVNGVVHSGDKVAFGDYDSSDSDHAKQVVNRLPVSKKLTVRYSPEDVSVAVLEPGIKGQSWFMPIFGAVFLTVGVAMAAFLPRAMRKQAEQAKQVKTGNDTGVTPADFSVPETHPKVTVTKSFDGTVFETRNNMILGIFMVIFPIVMACFLTFHFTNDSLFRIISIPFYLADMVFFALGVALFLSRYTVAIAPGKVRLTFGVAGKGYRKEIARTSPMSVTLENRGASKNGRPADSIVVRNATGEEFHFGPFLDDSRKQFLAGHLARHLAPKSSSRANPFA